MGSRCSDATAATTRCDRRHIPLIWTLPNTISQQSATNLTPAIEAEQWYNRWAALSDLDHARANYAKSMLCARHHPPYLRSIDEAGRLLEEAYELFEAMTEEDNPKLVFEKVFDRNGYALVQFRRGNVDSAVDLVTRGIETLDGYSGSETSSPCGSHV